MKKISIILPVYNAGKNLNECLKSINEQTFKDFELICTDSASSDNSLEILEKFSKKDSRIRIINKINEGKGHACNTGINAAEGEYISIIEPCDFMNKKMFENLYKLAKKSEADIIKSPYYKFSNNSDKKNQSRTEWSKYCKIPNWFFRINECPSFLSFHPGVFASLYKKSFLNNNSIRFVETRGYNSRVDSFIDMPFYIETMLTAGKIVYTDIPYYYHKSVRLEFQDPKEYIFPFDRIEEVLQILIKQKIKDKNIIANVYKRILKITSIVFEALDSENSLDIKNMPYEIQLRAEKIISALEEDIINNSLFIDDFERRFFNILNPDKII